jgi:AcrR family transcriptional regulator
MRERIVEAAVSLTTEAGWARVTMAAIADRVGVSRQTVYNEVGTKPGLAEAMILHELDRFLGVVNLAFDAHPRDLVARSGRGRATYSCWQRATRCCTPSCPPPTARTPSCCRC